MLVTVHRLAYVLVFSALASYAQTFPIIACSSSPATSGHPCGHAFDKNTSTYWESNAGSNNVLLSLDLGAVRTVKKIVITWGGSAGPIWFKAKTSAGDPGMDFPARNDLENITPHTTGTFSFSWGEMQNARYLELRDINGGALSIKEIAVHGMGVYGNDNEILSKTYPLGNLDLSNASHDITLTHNFDNSMANRLVAISTVVCGNDGMVQNLERMAGPPFRANGQGGERNDLLYGGRTEFREDAEGLWKLHVRFGNYFLHDNPNYQGTSVNRGYVTLYYLANDPQ